jgi:catechol 2,3-dioxygenase-like lactoylglutathione lyase family enzyme
MPRATRVHHVTVVVTDLEKAAAFYGGLLGLPRLPRPQTSPGLFFQAGEVQLHITLADQAEPPSPRHVAFEVDDLDAVLAGVAGMGLPVWDDSPIAGWVRKQCRDPFGNGVELLQRVEA